MKQFRSIAALVLALAIVFGYAGPAAAETVSITRELKVTAIVPAHRDIIVNSGGDILEITSNTLEDVTPQVFLLESAPQNKKELTPELLQAYREHVPEGTAKYGILYAAERPVLLALTTNRWSQDT